MSQTDSKKDVELSIHVADADDLTEKPHGSLVHTDGSGRTSYLIEKLKAWGVESRGIDPVPIEERTDTQYSKSFFILLSCNLNISPFALGAIGPLSNGLSFRESAGVIVGLTLLAAIPPSYFSTFGPRLGMRQMLQARYSFGWYGLILPGILQLITICGYNIMSLVLGGQILWVVSGGNLSLNVGIVVITLISLVITFFGYRVLNWYERYAWFPILIVFLVILGLGAKHSSNPVLERGPSSHRAVLSFGTTVLGFVITYATIMSDFTLYMRPEGSGLFILNYIAITLPNIPIALMGAAFAASLPDIPEWQAGYDSYGDSGILAAVLAPVGGFGRFLLVLLALSTIAVMGLGLYSFCFCSQIAVPAAARVPRYLVSLFGGLILIPLSIVAARSFETALENFMALMGYWSSAFISIVATEHLVFRRANFNAYDASAWNSPERLPLGFAAIGACVLAGCMMATCIDQVWYTGPLAKLSGDIGIEVGLVLPGLIYLPLRTLEKRRYGR